MMGMDDSSYWVSWFIYYLVIVTFISIVSTFIVSGNVIVFSDRKLMFGFFWIFGISLFGVIVFLQAFFTEPRTAAIAGTFIYFVSSFISLAVEGNNISATEKNAVSILSPVALTLGSHTFGVLETNGVGLT